MFQQLNFRFTESMEREGGVSHFIINIPNFFLQIYSSRCMVVDVITLEKYSQALPNALKITKKYIFLITYFFDRMSFLPFFFFYFLKKAVPLLIFFTLVIVFVLDSYSGFVKQFLYNVLTLMKGQYLRT